MLIDYQIKAVVYWHFLEQRSIRDLGLCFPYSYASRHLPPRFLHVRYVPGAQVASGKHFSHFVHRSGHCTRLDGYLPVDRGYDTHWRWLFVCGFVFCRTE